MKYQFVLQFPAASIEDYDAMVEIEEALLMGLGDAGRLDGHDMGSGEANIFIETDRPSVVLERVKDVLARAGHPADFKAAYREIGRDDFVVVHPAGLRRFSIA